MHPCLMKRRDWMLLCGFAAVGCGKEKVAISEEEEWIEMRGEWEGISGGQVDSGEPLRMGWGETLTTVRWNGVVPKPPFELELMAKRINGTDFFCAVTFPARSVEECVTLIVGGWGGGTMGISSIDGKDASENETTSYGIFKTDVWYKIRLVRKGERIETWIDGNKVIDVDTTGKKLSLREGSISECASFGLATWQTTGVVRNVRWRGI
jgi:hypothetical protein